MHNEVTNNEVANEVANNQEIVNEIINEIGCNENKNLSIEITNQINQLKRQIKYSKPNHYKIHCICELCFNYKNMLLTKEYLEKMLNNTEKQQQSAPNRFVK